MFYTEKHARAIVFNYIYYNNDLRQIKNVLIKFNI